MVQAADALRGLSDEQVRAYERGELGLIIELHRDRVVGILRLRRIEAKSQSFSTTNALRYIGKDSLTEVP